VTTQAFNYRDPFRPIYEYWALYGWAAASLVCIGGAAFTDYPTAFFMFFGLLSATFFAIRTIQALQLYRLQSSLTERPPIEITVDQLGKMIKQREEANEPPAIYLGKGFVWNQTHAQLCHTVGRAHPDRITPPEDSFMGQAWIHGIGIEDEEDTWLPLAHTAGHMLLTATTRAGKSRMLDLIIAQCVLRGEPVIVWDPKGDADLKASCERATRYVGRPSDFVFFHPAFPRRSWRIDPLANFSRSTELATRIASLISSEPGAEVFTAFPQKILTNLAEAMLLIDDKPTLAKFKTYVDAGPEKLVIKASEFYFDKNIPKWREEAQPFLASIKGKGGDREFALAYINYYRAKVQPYRPSPALEGLYGDFDHEKSHMIKLMAGLGPILTMLTAGTLNELLSPDPYADDPRPITNFARIIRNAQVAYFGLDSLSDNMVGAALGTMLVADMTAVSGSRYNFEDTKKLKPVNLIIDEAAELVSDKMIQLLNKSGGSNFRLILATQPFSAFAAKVGSADKARQVLGNLNNKLSGRLVDFETQEYITESMPQVFVRHIEYTHQTDARTDNMLDFGFRMSEAMKETEVPIVPPQLLSCLPSGEFFAHVSAGTIKKIRAPMLVHPPEPMEAKAQTPIPRPDLDIQKHQLDVPKSSATANPAPATEAVSEDATTESK